MEKEFINISPAALRMLYALNDEQFGESQQLALSVPNDWKLQKGFRLRVKFLKQTMELTFIKINRVTLGDRGFLNYSAQVTRKIFFRQSTADEAQNKPNSLTSSTPQNG